MKVGIIIPTYNAERYVVETLQSVANQSYREWRAVLVDDGSKDATPELTREFARNDKRFECIIGDSKGGAAAREKGFDLMTDCEAVMFFDHDDVLRPKAIERLVRGLGEAPAAHGVAAYYDSESRPFRPGKYESYLRNRINPYSGERLHWSEPTDFATLSVRNLIPIGAILIRREAKLEAGSFDQSYGYSHDWEMWLRIALQGPISFVDDITYDYRVHTASMSHQEDRFGQDDAAVWARFIKDKSLPIERRRDCLAGFQYAQKEQLRRKRWKALRRRLRLQFGEADRILGEAQTYAAQFSEADLVE